MGNSFSSCLGGAPFHPNGPQYAAPGYQPGFQPNNVPPPGYQPGFQPNVPSGFQPNAQPGFQPAFQPGYGPVPPAQNALPALLSDLQRYGLQVSNNEFAHYAIPAEDVVHVQSLRDALVNSRSPAEVSRRLKRLLIDGTNRSAFQGGVVLVRTGLLSPVFETNQTGQSTWMHSLAADGMEPPSHGPWPGNTISLAERFGALAQLGLSFAGFDTQGKTPCIRALEKRNQTTCNALLDTHQVDVVQLSATNALAIAAKYGCEGAVHRLLNQFRLNPNDAVDGATALHHAVRNGNRQIVASLVAAGADLSARAQGSGTPCDLADSLNHTDIARMLRDAAASTYPGSTTAPPHQNTYPYTNATAYTAPGAASHVPGGVPTAPMGATAGHAWGGPAAGAWGAPAAAPWNATTGAAGVGSTGNAWGGAAGLAGGAALGGAAGALGAMALANSQLMTASIQANAIMNANNIATGVADNATDISGGFGSGYDGGSWGQYGYNEGYYDGYYNGDNWYGN